LYVEPLPGEAQRSITAFCEAVIKVHVYPRL
jgi:hypothetical protein